MKPSRVQSIPMLGFGTYRLRDDIAYNSTLAALKMGYNHIDTANLYVNEREIGQAIKDSCVPREDLWITTKVQTRDIAKGKEGIYDSIKNSLKELDTEYLDLILLHGPVDDQLEESWKSLEEIILGTVPGLSGKVRYIGVSNYNIQQLEKVLSCARVIPYANQYEVSPFCPREEIMNYCNAHNIKVVAHTSLVKGEKFADDKLTKLSEDINVSKPLVLLAWALSKGMVVLPRSSNPDHIQENMQCINIKLGDDIIKKLDTEYNNGYCTHPRLIK